MELVNINRGRRGYLLEWQPACGEVSFFLLFHLVMHNVSLASHSFIFDQGGEAVQRGAGAPGGGEWDRGGGRVESVDMGASCLDWLSFPSRLLQLSINALSGIFFYTRYSTSIMLFREMEGRGYCWTWVWRAGRARVVAFFRGGVLRCVFVYCSPVLGCG